MKTLQFTKQEILKILEENHIYNLHLRDTLSTIYVRGSSYVDKEKRRSVASYKDLINKVETLNLLKEAVSYKLSEFDESSRSLIIEAIYPLTDTETTKGDE